MVIYIGSNQEPSSNDEKSVLQQIIENKEMVLCTFLSKKPRIVQSCTRTIHVFQKEFIAGIFNKKSEIQFVHSTEATTCCIIGLRSKKEDGYCFLAHLDGSSRQIEDELPKEIEKYFSENEEIICSLCGSYQESLDPKFSGTSRNILKALLKVLEVNNRKFIIKTACIDKLNTKIENNKPQPIHKNMAIDVLNGEAFPVVYDSYLNDFRELPLLFDARSVRICYGNKKLLPIKYEKGILQFQKFKFTSLEETKCLYILQFSDNDLLHMCSTSPECESSSFVPIMKKNFNFMIKYKNEKEYFSGKKNKNYFQFKFKGKKWMEIS